MIYIFTKTSPRHAPDIFQVYYITMISKELSAAKAQLELKIDEYDTVVLEALELEKGVAVCKKVTTKR